MFTKEPQEAWAEPPSFLIGRGGLLASLWARIGPVEEWNGGETCRRWKGTSRARERRTETNIGINMRPHIGVEGLFDPTCHNTLKKICFKSADKKAVEFTVMMAL